MNEKCFEQGSIQAFLDGETAPALSFEITNHAASCDNCALLVAQAEEENAQVFAMLDREMDTLVPTQRLWSSITVALAEEKRQHSIWDRIRGGILAAFASQSITVAASVLLVVGIFATIWTFRAPAPSDQAGSLVSGPSAEKPSEVARIDTVFGPEPIQPAQQPRVGFEVTNYPPERIRKLAQNVNHKREPRTPKAEPAVVREPSTVDEYLPGEESYIRTIASLKENVDARKDIAMSPSTRVSFERDLAVVNDSINKMKEVVRRDPRNQAAKQVLYSSYQNKIDLLNSVVEREELLASLQ